MKNTILIFLFLFNCFQLFSQDYDFVARKINENYNETHTPFLKNTIEKLGKQHLIFTYKELFVKINRLVKERNHKLESIQENFENQYKKPEYYSDCKSFEAYNQKYNSITKRAEKACAYAKTTLRMYNMCLNNAYRTTNCSSELNKHNRQVELCNNLLYEQKQYYNKAKNYSERCKNYNDRYNRAGKNTESNYNTTNTKYARLIQSEETAFNLVITELISIMNNALFPYKEYYSNGNIERSGNIIFGTGKEVGEWKFYHDNGKVYWIGKFENGKRTGEWKIYDKTGKLIETKNF